MTNSILDSFLANSQPQPAQSNNIFTIQKARKTTTSTKTEFRPEQATQVSSHPEGNPTGIGNEIDFYA